MNPRRMLFMVAILSVLATGVRAGATDVTTMDKIHVLMDKSQVIALMGQPHETDELPAGLKMEVYRIEAAPLMGAGFIYDEKQRLAGQAYIFHGHMAKEAAAHLKKVGFVVLEKSQGLYRLEGKDDDTDIPLIATISEVGDVTTLIAFEKTFYETHPLPKP